LDYQPEPGGSDAALQALHDAYERLQTLLNNPPQARPVPARRRFFQWE
jgi:hypothetical protein